MSDTMESREQRTLVSEREASEETKRRGNRDQPNTGDGREKTGPYLMTKAHALNTKLQRQRESARRVLLQRGSSPARSSLHPPRHKPKTVKFNKGYAALSQTGEDSLISLDSDSDAELDCSSGYSSAEVHPDLSRQLLKDGYHLDEIPDDEDLDLIPPKALSSSVCCCADVSSCCVQ
ncbi:protein FAM219B [Pimephales promelas]|uniref:protein FAM219B n=1 Tax=Pimephales promelas TaxID=90988 RepID=UPI001955AC1A|nr:protein FAM219B [Pimephales promelas]